MYTKRKFSRIKQELKAEIEDGHLKALFYGTLYDSYTLKFKLLFKIMYLFNFWIGFQRRLFRNYIVCFLIFILFLATVIFLSNHLISHEKSIIKAKKPNFIF